MEKAQILKMIQKDPDAYYKLINSSEENHFLNIYKKEYILPVAPLTEDFEAQTKYGLTKMTLYDFFQFTNLNEKITFNEALLLTDSKEENKNFIEDYNPEQIKKLGDNFEALTEAQKWAYYEGYNDAEKAAQREELIYLKG